MRIKVILEREYEINCDLEDLSFDHIDDICGMEEVDVLEDAASITTTKLVSAELLEEGEQP